MYGWTIDCVLLPAVLVLLRRVAPVAGVPFQVILFALELIVDPYTPPFAPAVKYIVFASAPTDST